MTSEKEKRIWKELAKDGLNIGGFVNKFKKTDGNIN